MGNLSPQQQLETDAFIKSIFIKNANVTTEDVRIATGSWKLIINNTAPGYVELKANSDFHSTSCLSFFFDSYYSEFFSGDQRSSEIYNKNMHIQGRAMISMMNGVLKMFEDRKTINAKLICLAKSHHKKGVSTSQYGSLVRGVLSALQKCLGSSFRGALSEAWYKIFSYILEIVVQKSLEIEKWNSYIETAGIMVAYVSNTFIHSVKDKVITEKNFTDNDRNVKVAHKSEGLEELKVEDIEDDRESNNCSTSKCKYLYSSGSSNKTSKSSDNNRNHSPTNNAHVATTACPFSQPPPLPLRGSNRSVFSVETPNKANDVTHDNEIPPPSRSPYAKRESSVYCSLTRVPSIKYSPKATTNNEDIDLNHYVAGNSLSHIVNHLSHTRILSK